MFEVVENVIRKLCLLLVTTCACVRYGNLRVLAGF